MMNKGFVLYYFFVLSLYQQSETSSLKLHIMKRLRFNNRIDHFPKSEGVFYSDIPKKFVVRVLNESKTNYISLFQSKDKDVCDQVYQSFKDGNIKLPKW